MHKRFNCTRAQNCTGVEKTFKCTTRQAKDPKLYEGVEEVHESTKGFGAKKGGEDKGFRGFMRKKKR